MTSSPKRIVSIDDIALAYRKRAKLQRKISLLRKDIKDAEPALINKLSDLREIEVDGVNIKVQAARRTKRMKREEINADLLELIEEIRTSTETNELLADRVYALCTQKEEMPATERIVAKVPSSSDDDEDME